MKTIFISGKGKPNLLIKKIIIRSSVFILLLVLCGIIIHRQLIIDDKGKPKVPEASGLFSKPLHDINRFHYTKTENTKRILVIQADRFRVQKKKIGLLRFALKKEIVVDNAAIDIYKPSDQKLNLETLMQVGKDPETMNGLIPKSTDKVIFSPVTLQVLSQEGELLSKISAESATFNQKNKHIVFDRNVEIQAGNRTLNAASMDLISKDGRVIARRGVVLKTPEGTITKDVLQTDMFLTLIRDNENGEL